ncbi:MAG: sulfatase family protein [Pirellulales bacterium]
MNPMLILLQAICLTVALTQCSFADDRPNFIIIIGDDVGWNDSGAYGHPHIKTPNIDQMAAQGLRFDAAFLTCSSCSPSRCSIMTGRYPHSTGASELHLPLPADQVVFAGMLKKSGYYTVSAGKWHLGKAAEVNFDTIVGGKPSGCENWVTMLQERPKDKPFFMWFAAFDAHRGWSKNAIPEPHTRKDIVIPPFFPDENEVRDDLALYYDEVSRLDSYTGKVLAELKKQGVDDNTLVIFMSDNGRPFPRCKTTVYDSGVQTPFVVRWPGHIQPGNTTSSLVSSIDIAPTFIELAGLKTSPTFQGKSFAKILKDPKQKTREYVFSEHNWHDFQAFERSVRNNQYLYLFNGLPHLPSTPPADAVRSGTFDVMQKLEKEDALTQDQRGSFIAPRPKEEFYDVQADPFQLNNLINDQAVAAELAKFRKTHQQWSQDTGDKMPEKPTPDGFDRKTGIKLIKGAHPGLK